MSTQPGRQLCNADRPRAILDPCANDLDARCSIDGAPARPPLATFPALPSAVHVTAFFVLVRHIVRPVAIWQSQSYPWRKNGTEEMRCRYNTTMCTDGLVCEFALRLTPLEGGGYSDHTTLIVRSDIKVRKTRQLASFPSQPIFLLAHSERLSQSARSNTLRRIGYSRVTDPQIEREVHA